MSFRVPLKHPRLFPHVYPASVERGIPLRRARLVDSWTSVSQEGQKMVERDSQQVDSSCYKCLAVMKSGANVRDTDGG